VPPIVFARCSEVPRHDCPAHPVFLPRGNERHRPPVIVKMNDGRRSSMSDYRNSDFDPLNPDDPYRRNDMMDPDVRAANAIWGWVAAAVFAIVVLAVVFGMAHQPGQVGTNTASNDITAPPAATRMAPPVTSPLAPPISPAPNAAPTAPAQPNGGQ
jgi:hypothetical protein